MTGARARTKGREGGVAEAVLGAMGAGVGPAAEGGEAGSMEEFTKRRIGRAAAQGRILQQQVVTFDSCCILT